MENVSRALIQVVHKMESTILPFKAKVTIYILLLHTHLLPPRGKKHHYRLRGSYCEPQEGCHRTSTAISYYLPTREIVRCNDKKRKLARKTA